MTFGVGEIIECAPNAFEADRAGDHRADVMSPSAIARSESPNSVGS